jgi:hypothetical protein
MIDPVTREETFLAAAADNSITPPRPITRVEMFLQNLIDVIRGGGTGGGGSSGGEGSGLPAVSAADNGKILQVVNGAPEFVHVADSSVKTYVDEYINSALEGEY